MDGRRGFWDRYWSDRRALEGRYRFDTQGLEWRITWLEGKLAEPVPIGARPWVNQLQGYVQGLASAVIGVTIYSTLEPG